MLSFISMNYFCLPLWNATVGMPQLYNVKQDSRMWKNVLRSCIIFNSSFDWKHSWLLNFVEPFKSQKCRIEVESNIGPFHENFPCLTLLFFLLHIWTRKLFYLWNRDSTELRVCLLCQHVQHCARAHTNTVVTYKNLYLLRRFSMGKND
jgi:hypothetical protein